MVNLMSLILFLSIQICRPDGQFKALQNHPWLKPLDLLNWSSGSIRRFAVSTGSDTIEKVNKLIRIYQAELVVTQNVSRRDRNLFDRTQIRLYDHSRMMLLSHEIDMSDSILRLTENSLLTIRTEKNRYVSSKVTGVHISLTGSFLFIQGHQIEIIPGPTLKPSSIEIKGERSALLEDAGMTCSYCKMDIFGSEIYSDHVSIHAAPRSMIKLYSSVIRLGSPLWSQSSEMIFFMEGSNLYMHDSWLSLKGVSLFFAPTSSVEIWFNGGLFLEALRREGAEDAAICVFLSYKRFSVHAYVLKIPPEPRLYFDESLACASTLESLANANLKGVSSDTLEEIAKYYNHRAHHNFQRNLTKSDDQLYDSVIEQMKVAKCCITLRGHFLFAIFMSFLSSFVCWQ